MLTRIKRDAEELLKLCFENYHLLSSAARKGILEVRRAGCPKVPARPAAGGSSATSLGAVAQSSPSAAPQLPKQRSPTQWVCFTNAARVLLCTPQANAGLTNHPPGAGGEFPPEALVAGMGLLEVMRDVFLPSDAEWLTDRCARRPQLCAAASDFAMCALAAAKEEGRSSRGHRVAP